jgi:hypothetical protein
VASYRKDDQCAKAATPRHAPSPKGPVFATLSSSANRDHPPTSAMSNAAGRGDTGCRNSQLFAGFGETEKENHARSTCFVSLFNSVFVFFLSTSLHAVEYGPSLNLRPLNTRNAFMYHASSFPHKLFFVPLNCSYPQPWYEKC